MNTSRSPLTLELALLAFLQDGPQHGYAIYRRLQACRRAGLVWQVKQSLLYAMLARLETEAYIASHVEAQGGGPPRKLMCLLPAGEVAYRRWLQTPVRFGREFRLEFLTKLFFAQRDGASTVQVLLATQRTVSQAEHARLQAARQGGEPPSPYAALVLDFRSGQMKAILDWLDRCEQAMEATEPCCGA